MPFIQLESLKVHYEQQSKGEIPIILLHGNFGSWHYWQPFLESLSTGYRAYAPDFRGCGDSQATEDGYDVASLCADIIQFADHLALDKFHLVGHSLGGAVAQQLAGSMPERIITLTLVAPAPASGMKMLQQASSSSSFFSAENIFQFLGHINMKRFAVSASIKKSMPGLQNRKHYLDLAIDDALKMDIKAFNGFLAALTSWSGMGLLKNFNFPVLIVYGDLDNVIPLPALKEMQQTISNCQLHIMQNIGHSPQLEHPRAFNKLLCSFIRGNDIEQSTEQTLHDQDIDLLNKFKRILNKFF